MLRTVLPSWEFRIGAAILLAILIMSVLVPMLSPYDAQTGAGPALQPPSLDHLFGTDHLGRDIFVRAFAAARLDFTLAIVGVAAPLLIGTTIGAAAAMLESPLLRVAWTIVVDGINAFPLFVLVMGIVAVVGQGVEGVLIALAATNWARYARITRARALIVRSTEYVQATHVLGYGRFRILFRHMLPNVAGESFAYALSDIVIVIVTVAGLSFLGLGVRAPTPEWGAMMADGRLFVATEPWVLLFPGMLLALTAVAMALVAEGAGRQASA